MYGNLHTGQQYIDSKKRIWTIELCFTPVFVPRVKHPDSVITTITMQTENITKTIDGTEFLTYLKNNQLVKL